MPIFKYRAKETTGNTVEGTIEAQTQEEAIEKISDLGILPVKVEPSTATAVQETPKAVGRPSPSSAPRVPLKRVSFGGVKSRDITAFGQQLASLIRAGVPILRAIGIVNESSENAHFKNLLNKIEEEVKNGASLSSALGRYPQFFPPLYLALVQAGEFSGTLDKTLTTVTVYRQRQEEIISRIRSAMAYPILMVVTGAGTIIFMLTFVMPRLMTIFSRMGESLPLPTKILIGISTVLQRGWLGLAIGAAAITLILLRGGKSKAQKKALSQFSLQLPVIGSLTLRAEVARFSRTLELLVKSGIPVLRAIEVAAPVVSNEILRIEIVRCLQDLKEGGSFGKSLRRSKRFPVFMTNLVSTGEESGKLDEALSEIANTYERETEEALRMMTSLLEPLMILVMGLVVGFIVISMLLPMFELNMAIK